MLKEGTDYTVTYSNNKKPGKKAKYTVKFIGNYKGRRQARGEFEISTAPFAKAEISVKDIVYSLGCLRSARDDKDCVIPSEAKRSRGIFISFVFEAAKQQKMYAVKGGRRSVMKKEAMK